VHENLIRPDLVGPLLARVLGDARWQRPQAVVHGDFRPDNCIMARQMPPSVAAVLDWELATLRAGSMAGQEFGGLDAEVERIAGEGLAMLGKRADVDFSPSPAAQDLRARNDRHTITPEEGQ
jgi:Phosphotransferase enzyme family